MTDTPMEADYLSQYRGLAIACERGESKRNLQFRARSAVKAHDAQRSTGGGSITVTNLVASRTREPFVALSWGEYEAQLTPEEARTHALHILEAAEAAIGDSLLCRLLEERLGVDDEILARMIQDLRNMRSQRDHE